MYWSLAVLIECDRVKGKDKDRVMVPDYLWERRCREAVEALSSVDADREASSSPSS